MRTRTLLTTASLVIAALVVAACGSSGSSSAPNPNAAEHSPPGDIPDNQAYVRFTPASGDYSVKVPEGWARSTNGASASFTDKLNTVRMEEAAAPGPLTVQDARQTVLAKLAKSVEGFQARDVTIVTRPAGRAIRITYLAAAPRNPVTGKSGIDAVERYVFFHRGKDLVLTLSGPKGADNVDPWKIVTDSVRWSA